MSERPDDSDRSLERGLCQDAAANFMPPASDFAERRRGNALLKADAAKLDVIGSSGGSSKDAVCHPAAEITLRSCLTGRDVKTAIGQHAT